MKNNTFQIHSNSLGALHFRHITVKDFFSLLQFLKQNPEMDSKIFSIKLMEQQVVEEISFQDLPEWEIKNILLQIIQNDLSLKLNIKVSDNSNLYDLVKSYFSSSKLAIPLVCKSQVVWKSMSFSNNLMESVYKLTKTIQDSLYITNKVFSRFFEKLREFHISLKVAVQVVNKYNWLITPSMPVSFIIKIAKLSEEPNAKRKINKLFSEFFMANNCRNLRVFINRWQNNPFFRKRKKILKDCLWILSNRNRKFNPANLVLPVLIAQIDGILIDFMKSLGISGTKLMKKKERERLIRELFESDDDFEAIATRIFFDILFQNAYPDAKVNWMTFNRHKILHGETVNYGKLENVIRAFLILDFLYHITKDANITES